MGQSRAKRIHVELRAEATTPQNSTYQEVDETRYFVKNDVVDVIDVDANGNILSVLSDNRTISAVIPGIAVILDSAVDTSAATGTPMIRNQELDDAQESLERLFTRANPAPGRFDRRENIIDRELNAPAGGQTLYDVADANMFKVGDSVDIISDEGLLATTTVTAVGVNADAVNNTSTIAVSGVHDTSALTSPFLQNLTLNSERAIKRNQEAIDNIDLPVENEFVGIGNALDTVFDADTLFVESSSKLSIDGRRLRKGTQGTRATHTEGAGNAQLIITSMLMGLLGNEVEIEVQSGAGFTVAVTKAYNASSSQIIPGSTSYVVTVNDNGGAATSQQIAEAINADADAKRIMQAQWGGDGTGVVSTFGPTNLAGGLDNGTGDYAEVEQVYENAISGTGFSWMSLHMRPNERNRFNSPPEDDEEMTVDYRRARDNVDR